MILPASKDIVKTMFGEKKAKQLYSILLPNDAVTIRINGLVNDVENQLIASNKTVDYFALTTNGYC